jgi:hypothetical protein
LSLQTILFVRQKIEAVLIIIDSRTDAVASWLTNVPLSQVVTRKQKDTPRAVPSRDLTDERLLEWAATAKDRYLQAMVETREAGGDRVGGHAGQENGMECMRTYVVCIAERTCMVGVDTNATTVHDGQENASRVYIWLARGKGNDRHGRRRRQKHKTLICTDQFHRSYRK